MSVCIYLLLLATYKCGVSRAKGPRPADEKQSVSELDLVLQRHQGLQEKLAEEMLGLARSLKTNTLAAQSVIKKDNQVWQHCSLCRSSLKPKVEVSDSCPAEGTAVSKGQKTSGYSGHIWSQSC